MTITFTFIYLVGASIQKELHCIQGLHFDMNSLGTGLMTLMLLAPCYPTV